MQPNQTWECNECGTTFTSGLLQVAAHAFQHHQERLQIMMRKLENEHIFAFPAYTLARNAAFHRN